MGWNQLKDFEWDFADKAQTFLLKGRKAEEPRASPEADLGWAAAAQGRG